MIHGVVIRRLAGMAALVVSLGLGAPAARAQSSQDATGAGADGLAILGDESSYLDLGAGVFNIQDHQDGGRNGEGRVEFRYGDKLFGIGPAMGLLADAKGAIFGYGGFYADIAYHGIVVTPMMGLGGYRRGGSEDLGGTFQFRLGLTVAYEFDDRSRLGVQFAHISNANVQDTNPGENELLATYAIPLNHLL